MFLPSPGMIPRRGRVIREAGIVFRDGRIVIREEGSVISPALIVCGVGAALLARSPAQERAGHILI
jgi:hypothetical protein